MFILNIRIGNLHCEQCELWTKKVLARYFDFPDDIYTGSVNEYKYRGTNGGYWNLFPFFAGRWGLVKLKVIRWDLDRSKGLISIMLSAASTNNNSDTEKSSPCSVDLLSTNSEEKLTRSLQKTIWQDLTDIGFEVNDIYMNSDLELNVQEKRQWNLPPWLNKFKPSKRRHRKHVANCKSCQNEKEKGSGELSADVLKGAHPVRYQVTIQFSGLANNEDCTRVTTAIENIVPRVEDVSSPCSIDLDSNTGTVIIPNKQLVQRLIDVTRDSGFGAQLVEVLPITTETKYKIKVGLGGITCASCVSAIQNVVGDIKFIVDVAVNVVSKTGIFISDRADRDAIATLKLSIEDCGYEFELMGAPEVIDHTSSHNHSRTVMLKVDGMYCPRCPEKVLLALRTYGGPELVVKNSITLNDPCIKFTYIPNVEQGITIRGIIDEVAKLISAENTTKVSVSIVAEESLNEHLENMSKRETSKIIKRIIFTGVIAIPTFVLGIVGMSLVPKDSGFRMWLDEPIWVGNVSRAVWILFILSTPVYFFVADTFHRKAIKDVSLLWRQRTNWSRRLFRFGSMNLLMSLGTTVAYFASIALLIISAMAERKEQHMGYTATYFDSVVFLTFFLFIGKLLEAFSKRKTTDAINALGSLKQQTATLLDKVGENSFGKDRTIDVKYLEIGDYIKIVSGQSPPVDCIIIRGESQFDESSLTGESMPVLHIIGDQVHAGTVNVGINAIIAKVSAVDGDSLLDHIIRTVCDGQLKRAPIERISEVLTGYFVPIIVILAIITWIVWLSLGLSGKLPQHYLDNDIGGWPLWSLEFAIAVFVIACPCGIGLAAPTALFVGAGLAAKYGILSSGGSTAFQVASKVSVVCFDKTGTLTVGHDPKVTNYSIHLNLQIRTIAIQLARDLASNSKHPISLAVKNFISLKFSNHLSTVKVPECEEIPGRGLRGAIVVDDSGNDPLWNKLKPESVIMGNEKFLSDNNCHLNSTQLKMLAKWKSEGKSIMITAIKCPRYFHSDSYVPVLLMAVRDALRPEAQAVIKRLQDEGIICWMISGDNTQTASAVAKELNIDNVVAEVLPDEKADKIRWIQQSCMVPGAPTVVAMVGDGINDAPALATADVGIALASSSDVATISSDFVIISPMRPLASLLILLQLSKKVIRRVRINFAWALIYNIICIPIAAGVIYPYKRSKLSPVWASAAMAASSISVVLSSMALRFFKPTSLKAGGIAHTAPPAVDAMEERFPHD
ncbi:heavy metal translocating P-type ATPase Ecym_7286 [Eremothecium cymbalariae DBVPG|uniref:HMA domain-containing protein n=1 Tax=Eremothecium cymbalariae (strain CBS 270.75 / DBVPG 7215 / KCTC 17166 / NRRL Y-17582) TaxID=931890 RepID=G8JWA9_ERECY|nr:hypothetical protein Ecym_7286 [Eremothecium cymbalariae DBVPG\